jgi:hypothetical protein
VDGRKKLIDSISSISPGREKWISRPVEQLPSKVAVNFKMGQIGFLEMKNPRAVVWAKVIDRLAQEKRPVYVEIDEETKVVTNILIPAVYKVKQIDTDKYGNLLVRLQPSQAIHGLLRSDPNFETMQASLKEAMNDGTERLITETRDEHEIIDVRKPEKNPEDSPGKGPEPPDDPSVSEARAVEVFDNMNAQSCDPCNASGDCIPFLYPDDGCWIRAHMMCLLMRAGGPDVATNPPEDPQKVWIYAGPGTRLDPLTANHPDCHLPFGWGWHVAPTLMVIELGGDQRRVIDPSLCSSPANEADWKTLQRDPTATLTDGPWTDYNSYGDGQGASTSFAQASQSQFMKDCRDNLATRCHDYGPPPYSCTKNLFFIIDRNTFSTEEIDAMLFAANPGGTTGNPAVAKDAFYVVVEGFSPNELGFTSATMQQTPTLTITPSLSGITIIADRIEFEYPTHLNRRQRTTWVYDISFTDTTAFTAELITVLLKASMSTVSNTGYLYLIKQPNPYEIDGDISWLSTDLRVFQINQGQQKFGANMGSDAPGFITQVINNLNSGNTAGQTFDNDISTDQQTSRLELSQIVNNIPVYNFAVAQVRYRARFTAAVDVRVFFRLFPALAISLAYDQTTTYRRFEQGGNVVPLLGIANGEVASIPCFASQRIDSAAVSMQTQPDPTNRQTIPPNPSGDEVVRYFGCWLDINQPDLQFPIQPPPGPQEDGPYTSDRKSVMDLIRNEHQCLVSEIAFANAPILSGASPSTSDKLAQRNLAIVQSANPGLVNSRRIPQTFEFRPSKSRFDNDELMIEWRNIPNGSLATLYLPGFDTNDILLLAAKKYRSHRLYRIDEHTLRFETGGITYLPIPFADGNFPGMLTVDLPEGVKKEQVFKIIIRQLTSEQQPVEKMHVKKQRLFGWKRVIGSFQLTIPVREKAEILPAQQRLLSNLRWIERSIPTGNRWSSVFGKYVTQIADRVDALGGNSKKVGASPTGEWQEAYRRCMLLALVSTALVAMFVSVLGALTGGLLDIATIVILVLLGSSLYAWRKSCRPRACRLLWVPIIGAGVGITVLVLFGLIGGFTQQLLSVVIAALVAIVLAVSWGLKSQCFGWSKG